jgi:hypothetical protein
MAKFAKMLLTSVTLSKLIVEKSYQAAEFKHF